MRGLGEACRLALEEAGVPYTQELYSDATWPAAKAAGLADGSLPFGQVPALTTGDGVRLVQSQAIVKYVAHRAGFACAPGADAQARCDMLAQGAADLRRQLSQALAQPDFSEATRAAFFATTAPTCAGGRVRMRPLQATAGKGAGEGTLRWPAGRLATTRLPPLRR